MAVGDFLKNHSAKDLLLDDRLLSSLNAGGEILPWPRLFYSEVAMEEARDILAMIREGFETDQDIETEAQTAWKDIVSNLDKGENTMPLKCD